MKQSKPTLRKAKLQPKMRKLTNNEITVPELKLNGIWLEKSGFQPGAQVEIQVKRGELIIKPAC